jgi:hypothetical protein
MVSLVFVSSGFSPFTVKAESWQINVSGLVSQQLNITLATLQAMPQTNVSATLFCVSAPKTPLEGGNWQGVKLWTILTQAGISSGATKIAFYASDGFTTDLTVDVAQDPSIIVAYTLNGTPLGQGELTRLVVPGHYGYKWIDQIISIVAVNYDYTGTYESEGYPDDGLFTSTNLPSFPTPNIPYPPSVTPTPINSPTTTHLQSPTTSPTASTATNSSIRPTSSSNVMSGSFEVIMIIVAVLIAAVVFTIVLKRKKVVKKKQHLSLSSTHIIKKELTAQFIV